MRPGTRSLLASAYRRSARAPGPEDPVEVTPGVRVPRYFVEPALDPVESARKFLARLPAWLDFEGAAVLDVGSGTGELCAEAARRGARRVLGVELRAEQCTIAAARLREQGLADVVEIRAYNGDLREISGERFDLILSKDSFEHYGALSGTPSAEDMLSQMVSLLQEHGMIAIGFGPPWKAPLGGHIDSRIPWAHLLIPEDIIFDEFRRARPGKTATSFEEGVGVARMTLGRFRRTMAESGLQCVYFATNVSSNPIVRAMRLPARLPLLQEYFTNNIYSVWRLPPGSGARATHEGSQISG